VEASNPVKIKKGKVTGTNPLKIKVGQKITLSAAQLVKCRNVGNIAVGDTVMLLQQQGGQEYIILGVKE
jgi:hypothetical protein